MDRITSTTQGNRPNGRNNNDYGIYEPLRPWDVVVGRARRAFHNEGNRRFRCVIALNYRKYMKAKSREEKKLVTNYVIKLLQEDIGVRFIKPSGDKHRNDYVLVSDTDIREKVSHALRDCVAIYGFDGGEEKILKLTLAREGTSGTTMAPADACVQGETAMSPSDQNDHQFLKEIMDAMGLQYELPNGDIDSPGNVSISATLEFAAAAAAAQFSIPPRPNQDSSDDETTNRDDDSTNRSGTPKTQKKRTLAKMLESASSTTQKKRSGPEMVKASSVCLYCAHMSKMKTKGPTKVYCINCAARASFPSSKQKTNHDDHNDNNNDDGDIYDDASGEEEESSQQQLQRTGLFTTVPEEKDILLANDGADSQRHHSGNKTMRRLVKKNKKRYQQCHQYARGIIISEVLNEVYKSGSRFLKRVAGKRSEEEKGEVISAVWEEASRLEAYEEINNTFQTVCNATNQRLETEPIASSSEMPSAMAPDPTVSAAFSPIRNVASTIPYAPDSTLLAGVSPGIASTIPHSMAGMGAADTLGSGTLGASTLSHAMVGMNAASGTLNPSVPVPPELQVAANAARANLLELHGASFVASQYYHLPPAVANDSACAAGNSNSHYNLINTHGGMLPPSTVAAANGNPFALMAAKRFLENNNTEE